MKRTSRWKQSGKQSWSKSGCATFLRLVAGQCSFVFGIGHVYSAVWFIFRYFPALIVALSLLPEAAKLHSNKHNLVYQGGFAFGLSGRCSACFLIEK